MGLIFDPKSGKDLCRWIAENSANGGLPSDLFSYKTISSKFKTKEEMTESLRDLQILGLIEIVEPVGRIPASVRPTRKLFEIFDPVVKGNNPKEDAATIAEEFLAMQDGEWLNFSVLCEKLAWGTRRMNPALRIIDENTEERYKNKPVNRDLIISRMLVNARDRANLDGFVLEVRGE